MRVPLLLLAVFLLSNAVSAQKFSKLPGGLAYRIIKDVPGTGYPVAGDLIVAKVTTSDSALKLPADLILGENPLEGFDDVLRKMTAGDIAEYRMPTANPGKKIQGQRLIRINLIRVQPQAERLAELLGKDPASAQAYTDKIALVTYFSAQNIRPNRTASGVFYTISKPGSGKYTGMGEQVSMLYTGRRLDGYIFDTNTDSAKGPVQPLTFTLQPGLMVKGFEEALLLLPEGGAGRFYIPSGLGYGPNGNGPMIPPHSILIFDIERKSSQ